MSDRLLGYTVVSDGLALLCDYLGSQAEAKEGVKSLGGIVVEVREVSGPRDYLRSAKEHLSAMVEDSARTRALIGLADLVTELVTEVRRTADAIEAQTLTAAVEREGVSRD